MKVTEAVIQMILNRLRDPKLPKLRQSDIAEGMGYGKAWMTKLLNGSIQNLNEDQVEKLEEILDIRFMTITSGGEKVPEAAAAAGKLMATNPEFAQALMALVNLGNSKKATFSPKYVPTPEMTKLGQEIIRIAFANEDKPGKVASMVLSLLR